jgi:hypothetical protein
MSTKILKANFASSIGLCLLLGLILPLSARSNSQFMDLCQIGKHKYACSVNAFGRMRNPDNAAEIILSGYPESFLAIKMLDRMTGLRSIGAGVSINGREGVIMQLRQYDPKSLSTEITILETSGKQYVFGIGD